jgi:ribA/ribD-fused uncharacterized protein
MTQLIHFYRVADEYGYLSNFAPFVIELDGQTWPTTEHYFQAQKFLDAAHREEIRQASSPMIAARMGRDRNRPLRADWERVKLDTMRTALLAKFTQHADLKQALLATGDAAIVEHTPRDSFWGDGGDGSGANWLGRLLMELRDRLRGSSDDS